MRKAASAFSPEHVSMRKALNRWSDVWVQRRSLRRAVASLVHSGLRAGFSTWADAAEASGRARESMVRVLKTLRHRGVRKALNAWHGAAVAARAVHHQDERAR